MSNEKDPAEKSKRTHPAFTAKDRSFLRKIGIAIGELRSDKGYTQKSFAEKCNMSRNQMNLIETGRTNSTVLKLRVICEQLGITVGELFQIAGLASHDQY